MRPAAEDGAIGAIEVASKGPITGGVLHVVRQALYSAQHLLHFQTPVCLLPCVSPAVGCRHGQLVMLGSGSSLKLDKVLYVVQSGIVKVRAMPGSRSLDSCQSVFGWGDCLWRSHLAAYHRLLVLTHAHQSPGALLGW